MWAKWSVRDREARVAEIQVPAARRHGGERGLREQAERDRGFPAGRAVHINNCEARRPRVEADVGVGRLAPPLLHGGHVARRILKTVGSEWLLAARLHREHAPSVLRVAEGRLGELVTVYQLQDWGLGRRHIALQAGTPAAAASGEHHVWRAHPSQILQSSFCNA